MFSRCIRSCSLLCVACLIHCGSSSSTTTSTTTEDDLATFVEWCGSAWDFLTLSVESDKTLTFPLACSGGGTMDQDGSSIVLTNCAVTGDAGTYTGSGTYDVTEDGTVVSHSWDQELTVSDDQSFTSTGFINFDTSDDSVAFDFAATFTSGVYRIAGSVSNNSDDTSDVTIAVSLDGEIWFNCTFDSIDLETLTDEEVDAACSESTTGVATDACSTITCSNNFECQLFADTNQSDAFTTANTQCIDSCCAIPAEEEDACADNTVSCTNNFQCQQFADNDLTDEFETNNVECSNGCCALTN